MNCLAPGSFVLSRCCHHSLIGVTTVIGITWPCRADHRVNDQLVCNVGTKCWRNL